MPKTSKTVTQKKTKAKKTTVLQKQTVVEEQDSLPEQLPESDEKRRVLYIMRHAKASKDYDSFNDKERPLIKRGKKDAKVMRGFFKAIKADPKVCFVSPAVRTRETFEVVKAAFPNAEVRFEEKLYDEKVLRSELMELLRRIPADVDEVLVVGHLIPPLASLTGVLVNASISDEDGLKRMGKKFPTAAVAVLELNAGVTFKDLDETSCRLAAFVRPKDLKK